MKFIAETAEEDALVQKLAKEHKATAIRRENAYAVTMWSVADVQEKHNLSDEKAEAFLEDYEKRLTESSVSGGWDFIEYADVSDYTDDPDKENEE